LLENVGNLSVGILHN